MPRLAVVPVSDARRLDVVVESSGYPSDGPVVVLAL
ncbi:hypothetical protein BJ973_003027 [Actinoplanes tereljensis]